jgi:hypothetical protein
VPTTFPNDDVKHQVIYALQNDGGVQTIAGQQVFPNQIPADILHSPCVVVNLIDGQGTKTLNGYTGDKRSTVQVDAYGDVSTQVAALAKAVKLRLMNHSGAFGDMYVRTTAILGEFDLPSDFPTDTTDRWRFRRTIRCDIFHCEDTE